MTLHRATIPTPMGTLVACSDGHALTKLHFTDDLPPADEAAAEVECIRRAAALLVRYWAGAPVTFDVPLALEGTPFQRKVWRALLDVPHGETVSYGKLARRIGAPRAVRAVGRANGANPIAIIVPCHRVIGSNGKLTGYGGGIERKKALLELEGAL